MHRLFTLKFNSPILPFAKFPLTQNKYIQDFLRKYEEDKDHVTSIIGVHFPNNNNAHASEAVGIEIEISKKNNITVVESNTKRRFKIKSYDEASNFCLAEDYEDGKMGNAEGKNPEIEGEKYRDLVMSEVFELKNLWFVYNKKINSILSILPAEVLSRYDMVAKTLQPPVFDIGKYNSGTLADESTGADSTLSTFDEIVYKMA